MHAMTTIFDLFLQPTEQQSVNHSLKSCHPTSIALAGGEGGGVEHHSSDTLDGCGHRVGCCPTTRSQRNKHRELLWHNYFVTFVPPLLFDSCP